MKIKKTIDKTKKANDQEKRFQIAMPNNSSTP